MNNAKMVIIILKKIAIVKLIIANYVMKMDVNNVIVDIIIMKHQNNVLKKLKKNKFNAMMLIALGVFQKKKVLVRIVMKDFNSYF